MENEENGGKWETGGGGGQGEHMETRGKLEQGEHGGNVENVEKVDKG